MGKQEFGEGAIRIRAGLMHRPEARLLLRVGIGARFQYRFHDFQLAAGDSGVQRLHLQRVLGGCGHIGARRDQGIHRVWLAKERGQGNRSESIGRMLSHASRGCS